MTLHLGRGLDLPLDAVTQKLAFMGRTGSGKTYGATKLAELMLAKGAQIVALDSVGVWFGLRLGEHALPIPVFGGLHGDLPLDPGAGAVVADLIVDRHIPAVLDVSQMLAGEQTRFAYDFAVRFFQRKKAAPSAVHLFLEECQEFVPQNPMKGEERMLHAFERIVKLGRNFGIGVSCLSQRPQEVNKKALNQTECLFAFQMTGPHERKALRSWIGDKGGSEEKIDATLPGLEVGHCLVWSPQWLRVSLTTKILPKRSLDASSTPAVGAARASVGKLSPIDLDAIKAALASASKDDDEESSGDEAALRERIADLEAQLAEAPVLTEEDSKALEQLARGVTGLQKQLDELVAAARSIVAHVGARADAIAAEEPPAPLVEVRPKLELVKPKPSSPQVAPAQGGLGRCARAILVALAQKRTATDSQLAILSGYSVRSSGFGNALSELRVAGLVEGVRSSLRITPGGVARAGKVPPMPRGAELLKWWAPKLGRAERSMLEFIVASRRPVSKQEIAKATGYSITSSGFGNALSKLRVLDLASGSGELRACQELLA